MWELLVQLFLCSFSFFFKWWNDVFKNEKLVVLDSPVPTGVKVRLATAVLGWETAWELLVLLAWVLMLMLSGEWTLYSVKVWYARVSFGMWYSSSCSLQAVHPMSSPISMMLSTVLLKKTQLKCNFLTFSKKGSIMSKNFLGLAPIWWKTITPARNYYVST